jgi:hypothetical protein
VNNMPYNNVHFGAMPYNNVQFAAENMWAEPYYNNNPMMAYPAETLENMYPECYYKIYPRVKKMCEMYDTPNNPDMYPNPTRESIERMTDNIYADVFPELGYPEEEDMDYPKGKGRQFGFGPGFGPTFGPGFGFGRRRRFLRPLISILLIRELLRRRGIFF